MTPSRKARLIVTIMMSLTGATFFFGFLTEEMARVTEEQAQLVSRGLIIRYIVAMAIGGAVAGLICAGLFGRHGLPGWLLVLLGAIVVTLLAGLIGSAIGQLPDSSAHRRGVAKMAEHEDRDAPMQAQSLTVPRIDQIGMYLYVHRAG